MTARFTQEDTYRGDVKDVRSLNLYAYCANDPVNFVDPSGHDAESNINSAFNAWQGGYITYEQYAENVRLNGGVPVEDKQYDWTPPSTVSTVRETTEPNTNEDMSNLMPPSSWAEIEGSYCGTEEAFLDYVDRSGQWDAYEQEKQEESLREYKDDIADENGETKVLSYTSTKEDPEVLVRYAVEQAGGTVKYNKSTGKAVVTMPGRAPVELGVGDYGIYIVNDRMVIKQTKLAEAIYGGDPTPAQINQFCVREGQVFSSQMDAVLAFALWFGPVSRNNEIEYGAVIDKYDNNVYKIEGIRNSNDSNFTLDPANKERRVALEIKENTVAIIHTHWHPEGSLQHSSGDMQGIPDLFSGYPKVTHSYVVNRNNKVYVVSRYYRESIPSAQI